MEHILFYFGIAVNIIGALLIIFFGIRYYVTYRAIKNLKLKVDELQMKWARQRIIGFTTMIGGVLLILLSTLL